ncbi:Uncharacterized protein Adt_42358 [Abeliophyllum distichum]|uniref:Uncharacterized protein n=1 Tax=Abeliophyllum distichum TaxID=126358 RepID=A0ABD1PSD7_9LAMI
MEKTTSTKGVMPLDITMDSATRTIVFFVMDGPTSYIVLLRRDWIHENWCVSSSLHQCLVFWNDKGEVEIIQEDHQLFIAEANSVERFMYERSYGPIRVVKEGKETQIRARNEEPCSVEALTELFTQMRPNIVAF